jgi:hypothetical protein
VAGLRRKQSTRRCGLLVVFHLVFQEGAKNAVKQKHNVQKDSVYVNKKEHRVKVKVKMKPCDVEARLEEKESD